LIATVKITIEEELALSCKKDREFLKDKHMKKYLVQILVLYQELYQWLQI